MIDLDTKAQKLVYTPATPETFGSVATYTASRVFDCCYTRNSSERNVRAGKDSSEIILTLWYNSTQVTFSSGDKVLLKGANYSIMQIGNDSSGNELNYLELKAD